MFAGKKSAQIREILISESAWEEMTCLFAPSLAQINGWRGETDTLEKMEKRIEYDLLYIRGWSIWLDLKIIFLTVFKGFINKSAY